MRPDDADNDPGFSFIANWKESRANWDAKDDPLSKYRTSLATDDTAHSTMDASCRPPMFRGAVRLALSRDDLAPKRDNINRKKAVSSMCSEAAEGVPTVVT